MLITSYYLKANFLSVSVIGSLLVSNTCWTANLEIGMLIITIPFKHSKTRSLWHHAVARYFSAIHSTRHTIIQSVLVKQFP